VEETWKMAQQIFFIPKLRTFLKINEFIQLLKKFPATFDVLKGSL
jgi:hypothetical protein